jgi:hypothetical protein
MLKRKASLKSMFKLFSRSSNFLKQVIMKKLILLLLFIPSLAFGAGPYYVRTDGHNTNCNGSVDVADSLPVRPNCAFLTIGKAESVATAGDTINIAAGDYPETLTINVSGTSGSRITFLGVGTVTVRQVALVGADYITLNNITIGWDGIELRGTQLSIDDNSDYNIVTGCIIDGHLVDRAFGVKVGGSYNTITGSTIKNVNDQTALYIGLPVGTCPSHHNTFTLSKIQDTLNADAIQFWGTNQTVSYNEIFNIVETDNNINHCDIVQLWTDGLPNCNVTKFLFEGNYVHDSSTQVYFINNVGGGTVDSLTFRNNVYYNIGMMGQTYGNNQVITNLHFYNNVFHKVGYLYYIPGTTQQTYSSHALQYSSGTVGEIKNNVFLECSQTPTNPLMGWYHGAGTITASNNYVGGTSYAIKTHTEIGLVNGGDPKFVNEAGHDYRIQSSSPLKDAGTTIASFLVDKNSISRPHGSAWDIGAFEFDNPPRNLRIIE